MSAAKSWFVVHTRANGEDAAAQHLARQGFGVYLPRYSKLWRHARRTERVTRPLFPRYLFVALDLAVDGWRAVRSTIGVTDIIRRGEAPVPVPSGVVEAIQAREDENGCFALPSRLKAGEPVRLLDGAFASLVGLCEGMADDERVVVLLELLGRKVRVRLAAESLEPA